MVPVIGLIDISNFVFFDEFRVDIWVWGAGRWWMRKITEHFVL